MVIAVIHEYCRKTGYLFIGWNRCQVCVDGEVQQVGISRKQLYLFGICGIFWSLKAVVFSLPLGFQLVTVFSFSDKFPEMREKVSIQCFNNQNNVKIPGCPES